MKNLFLDTNVIIDVLADRKPFSEAASRLFDHAERGDIRLFVSALSYSNIYYIIKKTCSHKQMLSLLRDLEAMTETLDVTKAVISKSLHSGFKDFEDAIQFHTAVASKKVAAIVTRNPKDFKNDAIAILTPGEALSMIENTGT